MALVISALLIAVAIGFAIKLLLPSFSNSEPSADALLGDPVLLLDRGLILRSSNAARDLFGAMPGERVAASLQRLFGEDTDAALSALAETERTGRPVQRVFRGPKGAPYEFRASPVGGQLRLSLHEAAFLESAFRAPGEPSAPPAAEAPLAPDPDPMQTDASPSGERHPGVPGLTRDLSEKPAGGPGSSSGQPGNAAPALSPDAPETAAPGGRALDHLLHAAPLTVWERDMAGNLVWAKGAISHDDSRVEAPKIADILAERRIAEHEADTAGLTQQRVEVPSGKAAEPLPLEAYELAAGDGRRIGFAVDASAAANAERTLARFVQTMTETFAHLTVGLAIFDRNQTLALFNPSLVNTWGLDAAWLAGKPGLREILDRLRMARRIPDTRDYHAWRERMLGLFSDTESADYEELWSLADGTTLRVLARPHPHGALAFVFDDVTEQMKLEQRYRHMEDLLRTALDRLDEGLVVFGPNGALQYVNSAYHEIWHTDDSSLPLQLHVNEICELCRRLTVDAEVWDRLTVFATGAESRRAWGARITMGSGRILSARFGPLPDGSTMAIFADVTDSERVALALQERNEALEAAEQMRGAVLDQISHRLRTPLNTVFGFGQLLGDPRFGELNERQQTYANGILEAAAQLLDTITEVTELASLQIDPLDGEQGGPSVEEVLEITCDLLERRADKSGVALEMDIKGPIGMLQCAAVRLRQIVFNMAADAIHRCPEGGMVQLCAHRAEDGAVSISTIESLEPHDEFGAVSKAEINSLTMSLVRRLVATEGGAFEIGLGDGRETLIVTCCFPEQIGGEGPV